VVSKGGNPISEGLALQAIRMIASSFRRCVDKPADLEARVQMQLASDHAGWRSRLPASASCTACRTRSGARHRVPHGRERHLLPHVMRSTPTPRGQALARRARARRAGGRDDARSRCSRASRGDRLVRVRHQLRLSEVNVPEKTSQSAQRLR